jgi:SAM-dependent methyltransferase
MESCLVCGSSQTEIFCKAFDRFLERREPVWDIRRCLACGFGWTSPPLPEAEIASHYPGSYLGNTAKAIEEYLGGTLAASRSWRGEWEKTLVVNQFRPSGRILDVGCGDGKFLWALDGNNWERTGVELSAETVRLVNARIPSVRMIQGDLFTAPLPAGGFDVITLWHVLEHLPQPTKNLHRISDLLAPGGWLIISVPRFDSLQARIFRKYWYPFDDVPRHLYHFSLESLERLLLAAGFRMESRQFFSRRVNFHSLKHSLLNWSQERCASRVPYYLLKPLILFAPIVEAVSKKYGMLTIAARKPRSSAWFYPNQEYKICL